MQNKIGMGIGGTLAAVALVRGYFNVLSLEELLVTVAGEFVVIVLTAAFWPEQVAETQVKGMGKVAGSDTTQSVTRLVACIAVLSLAVSVLAIATLHLALAYRAVRVLQYAAGPNANWGFVELRGAGIATSLEVGLFVRPDVEHRLYIAEYWPSTWSGSPVAFGVREAAQSRLTQTTLQVRLERFTQRFGVAYRLSGTPEKLGVDLGRVEPEHARVVRQSELQELTSYFWRFGGALCLIAFSTLWWRRPWWLRRLEQALSRVK